MHPAAERLARDVHDGSDDAAIQELAGWLTDSPRFRAFVDAHRDKVRKKLRGATDADARLDVRAELHVASLLLGDRRIELAFEPAGATWGGPDFAVAFRAHPAFTLEVTRLRAWPDAAVVARALLAKLRQLPAGSANVVLMVVARSLPDAGVLAEAARQLRSRADAADPVLMARGRFEGTRAFYQRYLRLGAVVASGEAGATSWTNPSARIPVPDRALRAALAALRSRDQRG